MSVNAARMSACATSIHPERSLTLRSIPRQIMVLIRELPPALIIGRGMPLVGPRPKTTLMLISAWITFVLPREIVKPLMNLKHAVDDAAAGNYQIEFELEGSGEVADLAKSVCNLISHITEVRQKEAGLVGVGRDKS